MKSFFLIIMAAYLCGNIYIFVQGLQAMSGAPLAWKIIASLIFWLAASGLVVSMGLRDAALPEYIAKPMFRIGSVWLVFTLYMVLTLLAFDITRIFAPSITHSFFYALVITVAVLIYGHINYLTPRIAEIDIQLDKPLDTPLKVVAISDVHLGEGTSKRRLKRYVELINRQQADVVVIGGDLIDNSITPLYREQMHEELNMLNAPQGVYMAVGNHEFISGIERSEEFLAKTDITVLRDEVATLPCGVQIIGRDDRSNRRRKGLEELLEQADTTKPILLLDHQPYELSKNDSLKVDIEFCGHTHRGQVWPLSWLVDSMYEQSHGFRKWSYSNIYVSSGLSLWGPPFRIGTSSDMAVFNIYGNNSAK